MLADAAAAVPGTLALNAQSSKVSQEAVQSFTNRQCHYAVVNIGRQPPANCRLAPIATQSCHHTHFQVTSPESFNPLDLKPWTKIMCEQDKPALHGLHPTQTEYSWIQH